MRRLLLIIFGAVAFGGALLFGWGVLEAQRTPAVVRYRVAMPGLAAPLRIVQLSDLHASRIDMPDARLRRIVAEANALEPDLTVLTGDYISGYPDSWSAAGTRAALAPLAGLRARLGVYAIVGNHDDIGVTRYALLGSGITLLVGARADAGPLRIIGSDDLTRGSPAVEAMRRLVNRAGPGRPIIVLSHEPLFFLWLPPRGALLIAGHTHGGQIRLPLLNDWMLDDYTWHHLRGLFREGGNTLIVSSGVGTTALPVRIGVPPEIVEITLVPARSAASAGPG